MGRVYNFNHDIPFASSSLLFLLLLRLAARARSFLNDDIPALRFSAPRLFLHLQGKRHILDHVLKLDDLLLCRFCFLSRCFELGFRSFELVHQTRAHGPLCT